MRTARQFLGVAALLTLNACTAAEPAAHSDPMTAQTAKQFHFRKVQQAEVGYLLFLPRTYEPKSSKRWPLILFLHGAGERGTNIWDVAKHGPPKIAPPDPGFPFIVVSPQCPEGQIWSNDILLGLLDRVAQDYAVDTNRIYLAGLSMGGYGTWGLGLTHPERFAAIVPVCGGGEWLEVKLAGSGNTNALRTLGVWAFHGAKDPVVPLEESQRMVTFLKNEGVAEVRFTVYPEAGHDCWTETFSNPELYQWLLAHERKPAAAR